MEEGILVSDYLNINFKRFDESGIFDAVVNIDSAFFINLLRLKNTIVEEFDKSYENINDFFSSIATLLENSDENNMKDKCFKTVYRMLNFSEVNGINLGFSKSKTGSGWGSVIRKQVAYDAYIMVKKGCKAPELFHLLQLFEENIGPDRLSDMIATIILPDIVTYTRRIEQELEINKRRYPGETFVDGLWINPYKNCPFLFIPSEILHELPVAKDWEDVENVIIKNNIIRQEINYEIGEEWTKWASRERKEYLKNHIFMNPMACERVIEGYKNSELEKYDFSNNKAYFILKLWQRVKGEFDIESKCITVQDLESEAAASEVVEIFKDWVENNRGWSEILATEKSSREKSVQRLIHLAGKYYIKANNLDMSCEANEGPGPVDFKISRGADKTVVELKLSSNVDYLHGYEQQIEKYAKAENTEKMLYVLVDVGNPIRISKLRELHQSNLEGEKDVPDVIIIDSTIQKSASKR